MEAVGPSTDWISLLQWITLRATPPGSLTLRSGVSLSLLLSIEGEMQELASPFSLHHVKAQQEHSHLQSQEVDPHQTPHLTAVWSYTSQLSELGEIHKRNCCVSQPVYSIFVIAAQAKLHLPLPWHCAKVPGRVAMQLHPLAQLCRPFTAGSQSDWPVIVAYRLFHTMDIIHDARDTKVNRIRFSSRDFCLF